MQENSIGVRVVKVPLSDQRAFGKAHEEENRGRKESNKAREREDEDRLDTSTSSEPSLL